MNGIYRRNVGIEIEDMENVEQSYNIGSSQSVVRCPMPIALFVGTNLVGFCKPGQLQSARPMEI